MIERKALGKGIGALIQEREPLESGEKITYLKICQIKPNLLQPREYFNDKQMEELTQSIKEKGLIQPIVVRSRGEHYEIIAGERRFRAVNSLGFEEIPAIIKNVEDCDALEMSLIENIQRQDLNPIEEASAYQYLIDKYNITQEKLSEILGKARVTIANTLRLLKLPQDLQEEIKKHNLSFAHGRALIEIEDINQQRKIAQETIAKKLSVRELENLIKSYKTKVSKINSRLIVKEPYIAFLEEELQRLLATKVKINKKKKRGHIVIEFYSQEDLNRILGQIKSNDTV